MSRKILETRRQVMSAVVIAYPGGRECAAARLGQVVKKLDNHVYENAGCQPLTDEQIHMLEQVANTTHLPDYICALYGGIFVPVPDAEQLDNLELYKRSVQASAACGAVDQIISDALANGQIDEGEAKAILEAHRRHMAARHSEVQAVIVLHRQ